MTEEAAPKVRKPRARTGKKPPRGTLGIPPPSRRLTRPDDIAIVGAGPAGLAVALMLARQGRGVVVHERFDTPRPIGAGLMLQPTGLDVLDRLGLTAQIEAHGQHIDHIFGREARRGRVVLDVRYSDLKRPRQAVGIHRAALFAILFEACVEAGVGFETDREIVAADGGRLIDSTGGRSAPFSLVIDASGARSAISARMGVSEPTSPGGLCGPPFPGRERPSIQRHCSRSIWGPAACSAFCPAASGRARRLRWRPSSGA